MAKQFDGYELEEIADLIVYDLEGEIIDRRELGDVWNKIDRADVDEIREYWRDLILKRLKDLPEIERVDSDFYVLGKD